MGWGTPALHDSMIGDCLVCGSPDAEILSQCLDGPGDLWHSGLVRAAAGLLGELKYWKPCGWWYLNDAAPAITSVAWRVDASAFVVRQSVWECLNGFDRAFTSQAAQGLDFGFRLLRSGGVPLHVPGLFPAASEGAPKAELPREDIYLFFVRHFKRDYSRYVAFRESMRRRAPYSEWCALREAERRAAAIPPPGGCAIPPRSLAALRPPFPRVSVIMPTMGRQEYAADLLIDLARQTLPPHEVFVVDATPEAQRQVGLYENVAQRVPLRVIWQESLGSCRARNEAIRLCSGDYILFADDDTRVLPDYIENHVRLLQTYRAHAANGLDIRADHHQQGCEDLARKIAQRPPNAPVHVESKFSNANSCVRREWVEKCIGNDVNFDGGYGEDSDFGQRLAKKGAVVLHNPYSANLHLKPPAGGFRLWGQRAAQRRRLPWEFNRRTGWIKPKPSPTIVYGLLKHYTPVQVREWFLLYVLRGWWPRYLKPHESSWKRALLLGFRVLKTPLVLLRIRVACRFARDLWQRGPIYE